MSTTHNVKDLIFNGNKNDQMKPNQWILMMTYMWFEF